MLHLVTNSLLQVVSNPFPYTAGRGTNKMKSSNFKMTIKNIALIRDFPSGPVGKTLPSNAGGAGSTPGWRAKVPHASWPKNQNIKQKQYCNKIQQRL